ncbi:Protein CBG04349 [Caenorhabditis briggsae]|nr:Protein CBG04349 [Caenorhabditis briggsae]CAP25077.2 Protein CBG04349 [Caenorhabditis briggsae]
MKELLVLPGKVWNFDPKVLEKIENFPLDGEDVKAVSDGTNVLETIRNVQNGLEMMKTLDVENLGIKDSWDLLDSSLSQFFEILSSQKIWNSSNVSFPTNLPIDTIKTFIEDEYQENQRNDILNFLKEIQILKTDFHEYPNKLEKMNEAMEKMKRWEDEKMNPVKTMVDCFEMECNASLKLPEASN